MNEDLQAGAAFPAKKTTRGLTFFFSSAVIALRVRYLCKTTLYLGVHHPEKSEKTYVDNTQDVQG